MYTGLIGQLKQDTFNILDKVQQRMADCIKSVGNIEHEVYPTLCTYSTCLCVCVRMRARACVSVKL